MKKSNNLIIYGEEARNIIKEITVIPSEKSKENGKKLVEYFNTLKDKRREMNINANDKKDNLINKEFNELEKDIYSTID